MKEKQKRKIIIYFIIALASLVTALGFMTSKQLAGHDTAAYLITQHQFHKNIFAGDSDSALGTGHAITATGT